MTTKIDSVIINDSVNTLTRYVKQYFKEDIPLERAFIYAAIDNLLYRGDPERCTDIHDCITDGTNDGGIDFVVYDDDTDDPAVIIGQSKCDTSIRIKDIINEVTEMERTIKAFRENNCGRFNKNVCRELQEALDTLPEDKQGSIKYYFVTTADVNTDKLKKQMANEVPDFDYDLLTIYQREDIEEAISSNMSEVSAIEEDYIEVDNKSNVLTYESKIGRKGICVNATSSSLLRLYNLYIDKGLLSRNIREYVRSKSIDDKINGTLNKDRDDFWFYNNGITIACSEFWQDGNRIKMLDFSIVNGGQTTTLIGKYSGSNNEEFCIPCKIISHAEDEDPQLFFTQIAEATNSQKPIKPRDLKSNSREMQKLQNWLKAYGIFLEIKRGIKAPKKYSVSIGNEALAQLILSYVYQQPGTARNGKRKIWDNSEIYRKIFVQNYEKDPNKQKFILDLIDLYQRFSEIEKALKSSDKDLGANAKEALKNGKMAIFASFGMLYNIINNDVDPNDVKDDPKILDTREFTYGAFISNYKDDDIDDALKALIVDLSELIYEVYEDRSEAGTVSSISNMLKTDANYRNYLLPRIIKKFQRNSDDFATNAMKLFSRETSNT